MKVRVMVLLYGDYPEMHNRLLNWLAWLRQDSHVHSMVLWANQVGAQTRGFLDRFCGDFLNVNVIYSEENVKKYVVMSRIMKSDPANPVDFFLWIDDDTAFTATDWFSKAVSYIESKKQENVCYVGQKWFVHWLAGQESFLKKMPWYTGRPSEIIKGKPGVWFAQGSWWWLRADIAERLNWPPVDYGLSHNGGDVLAGAAIYQQNLPFHAFWYGVKPNAAPRRGFHEAPVGCSDQGARR